MDLDIATLLEGDWFWTTAFRPVPVDPARSENADVLQRTSLEQSEPEIRGFSVRKGVVAELFIGIEIRVVRAGDQGGAGREAQSDVISQAKRARHVLSGRKVDGATRSARGVDGGLDCAGVLAPAGSPCAKVAHIDLGGFARAPKDPRKKQWGDERTGAPQERAPRKTHVRVLASLEPATTCLDLNLVASDTKAYSGDRHSRDAI